MYDTLQATLQLPLTFLLSLQLSFQDRNFRLADRKWPQSPELLHSQSCREVLPRLAKFHAQVCPSGQPTSPPIHTGRGCLGLTHAWHSYIFFHLLTEAVTTSQAWARCHSTTQLHCITMEGRVRPSPEKGKLTGIKGGIRKAGREMGENEGRK